MSTGEGGRDAKGIEEEDCGRSWQVERVWKTRAGNLTCMNAFTTLTDVAFKRLPLRKDGQPLERQ